MIYLIEHKTTSEDITPGSTWWKRLTLDGQASTYVTAARAIGHDVSGVLYDVLRKTGLKPARATLDTDRKYTKEGKLYANQRATDEHPDEYEARIVEDIAAQPARYYGRGTVVRLAAELAEHEADVWQMAEQMRHAKNTGRYPRNVDSCVQFGRSCDYWPVCSGEAAIDDPSLYQFTPTSIEHRLPVLSASALKAWRSCPRRYQYSQEMRMRSRATSAPLTFGVSIHKSLEAWLVNGQDLDAALGALVGLDGYDLAHARALMRGYHARWADERIDVVAVEHEFTTPLVNPDTGAASRSYVLGGRFDALAQVL